VQTFETHPKDQSGFMNSVLWASPDGKYLAGQPGPVVVWEVATGRVVRELPRDIAGSIGARLIFLTGDRLAVAMKDHSIAVMDVASGRTTASLKGHAGAVASLAVTPDGEDARVRRHEGQGASLGPAVRRRGRPGRGSRRPGERDGYQWRPPCDGF
jgi:WD40 repeat protein